MLDAVAKSKATVNLVTYGSPDTGTNVTQNVVLATEDVVNGTAITWTSNNPSAISASGVVVRSATATVVVTLTATIKKNAATVNVPVVLTVMQTDVGAVPSAKAALAITYATGDSLAKVTRDLTLPDDGLSGTTITWSSSNLAVISNSGVVTSPSDADIDVTMTATITKGVVTDTKGFTVKVFQSDSSAVAAAKAALVIVFGAGETEATSVTKKLTLATTGLKGTTITWSSDTPKVISSAGVITRDPNSDSTVVLTATITKTSIPKVPISVTKVFTSISVPQSEIGAINEAKADIVIGFSGGETVAKVTKDLSLPSSGTNTTAITWTSSAPTVITAAGIVKRPTTADAIVNLTATVRKGTVVGTKIYKITVPQSDASALDAAQKALALKFYKGDNALSVTNTVYLAPAGIKGTSIVWHSDSEAINDSGLVKRLPGDNAIVTLKATLTRDGASINKEFVVKVPQMDAGAVDNTKTALGLSGLTYAPGDTTNTVRGKITLPTKGSNGATITWSSDQPKVVNASGTVVRQADGDTTVNLTATIKKNTVTESTSVFTIKVLQSDLGTANVDKAAVTIGYNSGDTQTNVTHNLTLPLVGDNGTIVSWTSSNEAVINSAGGVTQVLAKDTNVTLTASIKKNTSITKTTFILTVPKIDDTATSAAKTSLAIGYSRGDKVTNVTKDLNLPLKAANKAIVTWSSNKTELLVILGL